MIPILILAAGTSSRMKGVDKLLMQVNGKPLLRRQVQMAQATGCPVYVALAPDTPKRSATIADFDCTVLEISGAKLGQSSTLAGAIDRLPKAEAVMVMLGDLVALTTADLLAVLNARSAHPDLLIWRGATSGGLPGHPVLFDVALRAEMVALTGDSGGKEVLARHKDKTHLVRFEDDRARFDLDTPEDWARWQTLIS